MAKTQFSFSDDQSKLGAPRGFKITVREIKVNAGAGFLVAKTGNIMTMPGLPKVPAAERIDVDEDGNGYTMYADQYYKDKPMVYADWDSTFVAYCLYHAGVPQDIIPQYASISALRGELARMNSEYYTDDSQDFASILPGDIVMYKNAEGRETIGVVSDAAVDEETDLTTALTVISGDVATGYEPDGETTIDQVAEVSVALNDVTSFVSVNAAEGYGISDLMDGEQGTESLDVVVTGTPIDLTTLNPTITALKKTGSGNNDYGPIEDGYEFTEGDSVKIEGKFKIKSSYFADADSNTVTWDIGLKLPAAVSDRPITALVKNESGGGCGSGYGSRKGTLKGG